MDVTFESGNLGDIVQAKEHEVWQNGTRKGKKHNALDVNVGDLVYIFPTASAATLAGREIEDLFILTARLKRIDPPGTHDIKWVGEVEYPESDTYILENCVLSLIGEVDPEAVSAKAQGRGLKYVKRGAAAAE